jgi:hypothetical protein
MDDNVRERLARLIDPDAWMADYRHQRGMDTRRRNSLRGSDRILAAGLTPPDTAAADDWRSDPSGDGRWIAGCDFAITQMAAVLGIEPDAFSWDAATEELEGDVRAVIGNVLTAKFGDDWPNTAAADRIATLEAACLAANAEIKALIHDNGRLLEISSEAAADARNAQIEIVMLVTGMDSPVWRALAPHCRDWLPQSLAAMAEARERLERIDRETGNG